MLTSIENARHSLSKTWIALGGFNVLATAIFVIPLFRDLPSRHVLALLLFSACAGLFVGGYFTFRSRCGTTATLARVLYLLGVMEFMFAGGVAAAAVLTAGRPDLCWFAVYTSSFAMIISVLIGMCSEASALELFGSHARDRWKTKLSQYIDFQKHQVSPSLSKSAVGKEYGIKSPIWIIAVGAANIPLLFELYAGGRNNAIFLAAPVLSCVFAYINVKNCGPNLVLLLLLRKLEKERGRRFINADFEQIQELRRTFFLSPWLMKDYAPSVSVASLTSSQTVRQKKHRHRV